MSSSSIIAPHMSRQINKVSNLVESGFWEYSINWQRIVNSRQGMYTAMTLTYSGREMEKAKKRFTRDAVKLATAHRKLSPLTDFRYQFLST